MRTIKGDIVRESCSRNEHASFRSAGVSANVAAKMARGGRIKGRSL